MMRRQSGFSLLETLVAFTITAITLGVLFQIYAKGTTAVVVAGEYAEALALAESKLAGVSVSDAIPGFDVRGRSGDKYDWEIRMEDYGAASPETDSPSWFSLARVDVNVSWRSRNRLHEVALQTLKPVVRPSRGDE